jgi:hypothetical protein
MAVGPPGNETLADAVPARTRVGFELFGLIHEPEELSEVAVVFVRRLDANGTSGSWRPWFPFC